ncbi:MAG: RHS repeat-associated core domain-containing protein [Candidatus Acidiferrum sp.]
MPILANTAPFHSSAFGRFLSPDPDNAGADAGDPQSWNAYSYVLNNPLNAVDPFGLDCVYLNDAGTGVDGPNGVDRNSNSGECGQNGGTWFDGTINSNSVQTDPNSDWVSAEGVVGDIGSNQQFSCGGSACDQDALNSFANSITGGPGSVTVTGTSDALSPDASAIFGQVYQDARIVDSGTIWVGCTAAGALLGEPPSFLTPATHATGEAAARTLESKKTATMAARAYHTAADSRFTSGGKFSKVLVPRTAKALHPVLSAAGKVVSVAGWGLLAYDAYEAGKKCN